MKENSEKPKLNYLINQILKNLEIQQPNQNQLHFVEALLSDIGIAYSRITFSELLSQQEIACLYWAAKGKNRLQTAQLMNVKAPTVKTYHDRIKKKLKCKTLAQALYESIKYNIIKPKFDYEAF